MEGLIVGMGYVYVDALIGPDLDHLHAVNFLVDTGSFFTLLTPALAQEIGVQTFLRAPLMLADSSEVTIGEGLAYMRLLGRESGVPIGILDVPVPLLGVSALEVLGLKVNPRAGVLEFERPFGAAAL
jgi:predicted aspartyl protease